MAETPTGILFNCPIAKMGQTRLHLSSEQKQAREQAELQVLQALDSFKRAGKGEQKAQSCANG
jgi:hypothetical protein